MAALLVPITAGGVWLLTGQTTRVVTAPVSLVSVHAEDVGVRGAGPVSGAVLTASGRLEASKEAVLSSRVPGRLAAVYFKEEEQVEAGAILARLDDAEAKAQLQRARANLARAKVALDEQRRQSALASELAQAGAGNRADAETARGRVTLAESELQLAQADVGLAESALEGLVIRAPFRGTVLRRLAEPGEAVVPAVVPRGANEAAGAVITLADLSVLEAEVDVNEIHLAKLKVGQPAEVEVNAYPGRRFTGELVRIDPVADRAKGSVAVRVRLAAPITDLRPQLAAKVSFLQSAQPPQASLGLSLPLGAVKRTAQGQTLVFEVREGRAFSRLVALGEERSGRVAVRSGVTAREVLLANPPTDLKDGDPIEVHP